MPLFVDLRGRTAVLVGGGIVAQRKLELLLDAGADVTVIAPQLAPSFEALRTRPRWRHCARQFETCDLDDAWLVVAATNDRAT
ncbi:MAG: NAD(P)-dependent oxidoreductase, partial [Gammaproteobacteria bacterium]|nr:NAD(P)-dependent oxidoreductase [Gammaproteobacteria bacterium]